MRKMWLVAVSVYRQRVRSGSFLMLTFGLPLLMLVVGAATFFLQEGERTLPPMGIVDESGSLPSNPSAALEDSDLELTAYLDRESAQEARQRGEIEGYLVLPAGYAAGESPELYLAGEPSMALVLELESYLRRAAAQDVPDWILARLDEPASFTYTDVRGEETLGSGIDLVIRALTPVVLAIVFGLMVFTSTSQMGPAMVREKDERAMEMIVTSLAPRELAAGKVLGMTLLSLTQIAVWVTGGVIALALAFAGDLNVDSVSIPWQPVAWAVALGVPGYLLYGVLAAGLGIIAGDSQQARQLAGILGFVGLAPFWFVGAIVSAPDSPVAVVLTLFPLTSPMISLLRMALTDVALWQLTAALALIAVSLLLSLWFVARIFRAAMLLYGQSLRPRAMWQALRTS